jgi:hypothetical protein
MEISQKVSLRNKKEQQNMSAKRVSQPTFEPGTSRTEVQNVTGTTSYSA